MSLFNTTPGVFSLLSCAVSGAKADDNFSFYLKGDLHQMSVQKSFISRYGIKVQQQGVYPAIQQVDVFKTLGLIYENRIDGWWHYKDNYVELKICTSVQFDDSLRIQCERNK